CAGGLGGMVCRDAAAFVPDSRTAGMVDRGVRGRIRAARDVSVARGAPTDRPEPKRRDTKAMAAARHSGLRRSVQRAADLRGDVSLRAAIGAWSSRSDGD